jgi:hypothetical protein
MNEVIELTSKDGFKNILDKKHLNFAIFDNLGCHINFGFGQLLTNHTIEEVIGMISDNQIFHTNENDILIIRRNLITMVSENMDGERIIMTNVAARYSTNGEKYAFKLLDTFEEIKSKILPH